MPLATFSTSLGLCAIAWSDAGLTHFLLPDPDRPAGTANETEPPPWIAAIIARVPEFTAAVLRVTLGIKAGRTATYGEIAAALGHAPAVSRAVGSALGDNPWPLLVPCHRVVAATGKMTGFSGPGGVATKVRLLALEGAQLLAE